ncbi:MAG: TonB family protein [Salinivirgaceae bacterium]|nr:TonB family protein [Salinivirgaceae bacterium]
MNLTKEERFSIISSLIFLFGFVGLLLVFGFSVPFPPPEEEGILINFGTSETGSGLMEPKPAEEISQMESVPEETSTPEPTTQAEAKEDIITQDYEKTAVIEAKKKKEKEQKEIERKKQEELERIKQQEIEKQQKIEEERKQKEDQQKAINNRAKNAFGGKNPDGDNTGEGDTSGAGNQGKPDGDINSKNRAGGPGGGNGISFSLSGRNSQSLPKPDYKSQSEGKVVVEVTVNQNGNVVSARSGVKGTTTSNKILYEAAQKAALKAVFDVNKDAPALQKGTITYIFMLQ